MKDFSLSIGIPKRIPASVTGTVERWLLPLVVVVASLVAIFSFTYFLTGGLALAYNDARSHLDIGRRVVEGLKPGLAQLGSVWLPLPHLLMVPTVWSDTLWHTGLSGSLQSMISFVATTAVVYLFLRELNVGILGRIFGVVVFMANLNILYLTSTAMTEMLILGTMTAGAYYLLRWHKSDRIIDLLKSAFFVMLATVTRYDGWFLLLFVSGLVALHAGRKKGYQAAEGTVILFATLGVLGIGLWFLWNLLIFKDPLYFAFGPFSARAQQAQIFAAGDLPTQGNLLLSTKIYLYALVYNSYTYNVVFAVIGALLFWTDRRIHGSLRIASTALLSSLFFNILALYLGHSVLFIQGSETGNTWFNVRYGMMLMPTIAIFSGFLVDRAKSMRWVLVGIFSVATFFAFASLDAVTIDDALVGSSQKNVSEVSGWLRDNATDKEGYVLISAASHDAIIFSSGLQMKRFIHEGTGKYWESATDVPDRWARWIVMRTHDDNDLTFRLVKNSPGFSKFELVDHYPFADIYELKDEYLVGLNTRPVIADNR